MNTHGHQSVAEDAGLPLLKAAFNPRMNNPRLGAFYMGNWIADVSQVVDPVVEADALKQVKKYADDIFDMLMNAINYAEGSKLVPMDKLNEYESIVAEQRRRIHSYFEAFLKDLSNPGPNSRKSLRYLMLQPGVLLKGYFKFVHPNPKRPQTLSMDLGAYLAVFDAMFIQYYPHEHLDRPIDRTPDPFTSATGNIQYDDLKATGPRATQVSQSPDLYDYLRDDIEIIAGRLAGLDLNWANVYLARTVIQDDDVGWNLGLAELGHAVHGVEDFFAHSNYIEHAAKVMGGKFIPTIFQFIDKRRFYKRLKWYDYRSNSDPDNWTQNPNEDYIVTGYFDSIDTCFSMVHMAEDGLVGFMDIDPVDATRHGRVVYDWTINPESTYDDIVKSADKVIHDFLEIVDDPRKLSTANKDNEVVKAIQKAVDESFFGDIDKFIDALRNPAVRLEDMKKLIENMPLLREINSLAGSPGVKPEHVARILKSFFDFVRIMLISIKAGETTISLYKTYREIMEFGADPLIWLEKKLPKYFLLYIVNASLYFAKEHIYKSKGMERIGCHSLMSKDYGEEVLYEAMKNCATAVHYYIVETLLRWKDPAIHNLPDDQKWVDWLELIEHFTMHPAANVVCTIPVDVPVEIVHVPTQEELSRGLDQLFKDLAVQYQPVTLMPTGVPFTERKIFHANFSFRVNKKKAVEIAEDVLFQAVSPSLAMPVRLRRIIIPYIKHRITICDPSTVSPRWYMPVMKDDWKVAQNPGLLHTPVFHANRDGAVQRMNRGINLRKQWEVFYRPNP